MTLPLAVSSAGFLKHQEVPVALDFSQAQTPIQELIIENPKLMTRVFQRLQHLEQGSVVNTDEQRQVGHYWLRAPELAPTADITDAIIESQLLLRVFLSENNLSRFTQVLCIGIGGSALGPQFVLDALGEHTQRQTFFLDNTDPQGIQRVLNQDKNWFETTLVLVTSKSGGTVETRNGLEEVQARFDRYGINFPEQAIAITQEGSKLDNLAQEQGWLARFPLWDWVGGRTSITSMVGLVPLALAGLDTQKFLTGAKKMDQWTRSSQKPELNPALNLALVWYHQGKAQGEKNLAFIPYKDALHLFPKYLQQLIMESIGKRTDRDGHLVHQGLTVFGNKGSTDQHAYIQQLRDGRNDFIAHFIHVLTPLIDGTPVTLSDGHTSGDHLIGFWLGTRKALTEAGRSNISLTIPKISEESIGSLVALFERAVSLYADLININAYHQPGVEAGKKAAQVILETQATILSSLEDGPKDYQSIVAQVESYGLNLHETHYLLEHLIHCKKVVLLPQGLYALS